MKNYQAPIKAKQLKVDLSRYEQGTSKANSNRASLIEPFVKRLNASRKAGGYRPYSAGYVASKMSHIATDELDFFYKKLDQSKCFGGLWHYYCKPKKR